MEETCRPYNTLLPPTPRVHYSFAHPLVCASVALLVCLGVIALEFRFRIVNSATGLRARFARLTEATHLSSMVILTHSDVYFQIASPIPLAPSPPGSASYSTLSTSCRETKKIYIFNVFQPAEW